MKFNEIPISIRFNTSINYILISPITSNTVPQVQFNSNCLEKLTASFVIID